MSLGKRDMEDKIVEKMADNDSVSLKEVILKIRELLNYLLSKWLIILIVAIIGGSLGFTYARLKKPVYNAATSFVLESGEKGGGLGQYAGLASMAGIDLGGDGGGIFQGDNIIELYKSRTMIRKTLLSEINYNGKKQLLIDRYIDFNNFHKLWANNPELKNLDFSVDVKNLNPHVTRLRDSVIGVIVADIGANYLNVTKPDKKISIIEVDVKSGDEFFSKTFNEEIVKNVIDFYIQTKTKKSLDNISILQHKTDSVRAVLNGAIFNAAAVSDATPNLNITRQIQRVVPMQRSQFSAEINKAILSEMVKNLEMSKLSLLRETPLIQIIDKPVLPLEKVKLGRVRGTIMGIFLAVFLVVALLLIKRVSNQILTD
ncbi:hypothetical protein HDF26_001970 [Pedobacter cryoconitis]|uniref:Wzz/FepE/Etk N-terminal domain-containing protein n=1 Tax=Pedobacter cryoconitis TaxID=188932 RepID=UPI0017BFCCC7|nr:Wzz/FepE/Etk N-terminal domain-containing protein [Pedobacter cryoconitis]MBB6271543.1 hypothetical protein [Pedobacter cryoconitis]